MISKCRWQPVEAPVVPEYEMTCPFLTFCPSWTLSFVLWLYVDAIELPSILPWEMTTWLPYLPVGPEVTTIPSPAALIAVPQGTPKSRPVCRFVAPVLGWVR